MYTTILLHEQKVYMYVYYSMKERNVFILLYVGKECMYTTLCRKGMYVYYSMKERNVCILLYVGKECMYTTL